MEILKSATAFAISVFALLGTSAQVQAWSLEPSRRRTGVHLLESREAMWSWIRQTPSVFWSHDDEHPGRLDFRHHMSERVGWAWLKLASELSCVASVIALMVALMAAGMAAFGLGCLVMGLAITVIGDAYRRNGEGYLGKLSILGGLLMTLTSAIILWSIFVSN